MTRGRPHFDFRAGKAGISAFARASLIHRGWLLGFLLPALITGGCAGYRLGPTNGLYAREKSVQVTPFINQTIEPRLTDAVTSQLRKRLQQDGTFQLASHSDGDIVLSGTLTKYLRAEITFAANDILTVRDYRLSLTAQVTARERSTGRVILDQPVTAYTLIQAGSDLTSAERQAMPLLAGDLAKNVTALLVEGKW
jgi:lipopolysaccharide assembly LptE-like protein